MSDAPVGEIRGLRAAAKVTGRSPSGLQKMVDNGALPATKVDGKYVFQTADLQSLSPRAALDVDDSDITAPVPEFASAKPEPDLEPEPDEPSDAPFASSREAPPATASPPVDDGEEAAMVFADLNQGKPLCTIVVDHKLAPDVVARWYREWRKLSEIDALRTSEGEKRLFEVENLLEVYKGATDTMLEELGGMRIRTGMIERALGIAEDEET